MRLVLKVAKRTPVEGVIAARVGIATATLRYMLKLSEKGHPGDIFDLEVDGRIERFHILFQDAIETGLSRAEETLFKAATGQLKEILSDRGRVQYQFDPQLIALGFTGDEALLRDENGDPVPETIPLLDLESTRWLLARRMPEKYGNRMVVDHKHTGGVLVVGVPKTSQELEETYGSMRHDQIEDVEFEDVEGEAPAANLEKVEVES